MKSSPHIPPALTGAAWRASSYSGGQGNCVETATNLPTHTPVRDSKRPAGPTIVFSHDAWRTFLTHLG
ncbi:DUF397 domain-containing protein [Streptomyces aurantiacus]|uniref:DUF397 domain-containing protein n=1 Tax=Streptomyces aurantiacus TaxID=47760 RepID=A0A7G1PCK3_9ACTN|nr:DUF397 domain-containing protein [Streptomyces aurantiacus]BCL31390.1 hypothetical protein GCM10017557_62490 [Streptomyces aurantiacus]